MPKYSKKIVNRICSLIEKDSYTIAEICVIVGISERCFYDWQSSNAEFAEEIKKARDRFDELLVKEAKNSLRKKVNGYDVDETKTIYIESKEKDAQGKPLAKIKERTVVKKHFQPDTGAIIFTLTNKAQDEWKNKMNSEVTGKDGKDLIPARVLTKKEAQELFNNIENEY